MLKRISNIRNVGQFRDCKAGNVEFGKLTLVYGRNTYGKSTIGDVFLSLALGNDSLVSDRSSIPADGEPQSIELKVVLPGQDKELPIQFQGDKWLTSVPAPLAVRAFDDGFLHRNLFAGRSMTRATKESFSSFVLGAQAVAKANQIAEKRKQNRKDIRDRGIMERDVFSDIENIDNFIALTPSKSTLQYEQDLEQLRSEHVALKKQLRETTEIKNRPEGQSVLWEVSVGGEIQKIHETLALGIDSVHQGAKAAVTEHIQNGFRSPKGAERWIREGLNQLATDSCNFCGQSLSPQALELLEAYRNAFDQNYDAHEKLVKSQIEPALNNISRVRTDSLRARISENQAALSSYPELFEINDFQKARRAIDNAVANLFEVFDLFNKELAATSPLITSACGSKLESPHTVIQAPPTDQLIDTEKLLLKKLQEYNVIFSKCQLQLKTYKKGSNPSEVNERASKIVFEGKAKKLKQRRVELQDQCSRYTTLRADIEVRTKEISTLENELTQDQSKYLERFFEILNHWYTKFGNKEFTLECSSDARGNVPIYFLSVKYRGVDISESQLDKVFSESDRRSLALALFWTELYSLPELERESQIVVLDDPLTSFDDGRVTAVHTEIVNLSKIFRQVIVFSHYAHEIGLFLDKYNKLSTLKIAALEQVAGNSKLVPCTPEQFTDSEHHKVRKRLYQFVASTTQTCEFGMLRIFLEYEIGHRFAKQIYDLKLDQANLHDKVEGLREGLFISESTWNACDDFRMILNPSHHKWPSNDLEDQRATTDRLLQFVYGELTCG